MRSEITAASSFLASYVQHAKFEQVLVDHLAERYDGHWFPQDPERGSAFRALVRSPTSLDTSILVAGREAGLTVREIEQALKSGGEKALLGERWTLWVDPGCVSLRVDQADASTAREGQFIEIYGKLPQSLAGYAVSLASVTAAAVTAAAAAAAAASEEASTALEAATPASPVKRSKAIQIMAPPGGRSALQAMTNAAALQPDSPAARLIKPTALLASPLIIPPTPQRPSEADVFSPTPSALAASSALLLPRSPSPAGNSGKKYGSLSSPSFRPSSPLGMPLFTSSSRRSSSRTSSVSSAGDSCSDGETSCSDSLFSAGGESIASLNSAASSILPAGLWKGADAKSRDLIDADGFRVPALPLSRPSSVPFGGAAHSRGSSISSLAPPPSPSRHHGGMSPTSPASSLYGGRSLPSSPTKPRRRGVRGGQGHRSESISSNHSNTSSISSLASLTSTATPSTPLQQPIERSVTPVGGSSTSRSRTETSSSSQQQVATEYSNGLVKVLGGGVLLGCSSKTTTSTSSSVSRSTTPSGEPSDGQRRRRRERGRGGRGASGGAPPPSAGGNAIGGERSPSFSGNQSPYPPPHGGIPSPYQGMPVSPQWASPFFGQQQQHYGQHPHQHQHQHSHHQQYHHQQQQQQQMQRPVTPMQG